MLGEIWLQQNIDFIVIEQVKRWLYLPQNENFDHLCIPTKTFTRLVCIITKV